MLKNKYSDYDTIRKKFKFQHSPDTCWPTCMSNILNEFWEREFKENFGKKPPLSLKEIKQSLHQRGPHGQFSLENWLDIINDKIKHSPILLEEKYHQEFLLPLKFEGVEKIVNYDHVIKICENEDFSFPMINVTGDWFGHFGLTGWSDQDISHVLIIIDYDEKKDVVHIFDPASKYFLNSTHSINPPTIINGDKLMSFWDNEYLIPRWISWFRKKDMTLEAWA